MTWPKSLAQHHQLEERPLSTCSNLRVGGPASLLTLNGYQELAAICAQPQLRVLGRGCNLLVGDSPLQEPVLVLGDFFANYQMQPLTSESMLLRVGAAHDLGRLISICCRAGWGGLEHLVGIPASIGGALAMNAGSAHHWISESLQRVEVMLPGEQEPQWLSAESMALAYRSSGLPAAALILAAEFRLHRAAQEDLLATARQIKQAKGTSQPLAAATAGCTFKNPSPEQPAGRLIDQLGLKGSLRGGAMISEQHANFIINQGGAQAADVAALIRHMRARVADAYGIRLELEVQTWNIDASSLEPGTKDL